jgi:hypothetical protein
MPEKFIEQDPLTGRIVKNLSSPERMRAIAAKGRAAQSYESQVARGMAALPALLASAKTPEAQANRLAGLRGSQKAKDAARANAKKALGVAAEKHPELFPLTPAKLTLLRSLGT